MPIMKDTSLHFYLAKVFLFHSSVFHSSHNAVSDLFWYFGHFLTLYYPCWRNHAIYLFVDYLCHGFILLLCLKPLYKVYTLPGRLKLNFKVFLLILILQVSTSIAFVNENIQQRQSLTANSLPSYLQYYAYILNSAVKIFQIFVKVELFL